jgi:hypothetical protein
MMARGPLGGEGPWGGSGLESQARGRFVRFGQVREVRQVGDRLERIRILLSAIQQPGKPKIQHIQPEPRPRETRMWSGLRSR